MAAARRIAFREIALFDATVYAALVADQVETYGHDADFGVIETFDTKAGDYPNLREALRAGSYSFVVYQQRETEADHTAWKFSFAGEEDHYRDNQPEPLQFIRDVTR